MPHRYEDMPIVRAKICDGTSLGLAVFGIP
ncbi:MAG: hypothetical protein ACI87Q_001856, partial [Pseudohongiellaceae bacterium]